MASAETIEVEVVYARPARQHRAAVRVAAGTSVVEAIRQSGILSDCPEIDLSRAALGIYSRRVHPEAKVRDGDRIEIYRPLQGDPKAVRRERGRKRRS
jgi:putative ubiquitin-RnfH superfamily antitoxin RatB of RatAB toxin-antitoxin module